MTCDRRPDTPLQSSDLTIVETDSTPPAPPLIGALLRKPWETVRERMLVGLHKRGFNDLVAAHLDVLQYPGPENLRPSDLAAQARMTKQALNYLLGQMEQLGYLTRRVDAEDQRFKRIHLTRRGHAAVRAIREIVGEVEAEWEQQLGPRRFAQLRELLAQLNPSTGPADPHRPAPARDDVRTYS
jgi:DNA-binding MarR family transcriptional regulator